MSVHGTLLKSQLLTGARYHQGILILQHRNGVEKTQIYI